MLKRFGPPALVTLLLVATGIAFVVTERLKLEPPTITSTHVTKQFSPTCGCGTSKARVAFSLRRSERVTLSIIGPPRGGEVRQLLGGEDMPSGPLHVIWDGRDNAGRLLPDGNYQVSVHLANGRLNTTLPNVIQLDTQPPKISSISLSSHTISPDGDHRNDVIHIGYRVNERARVFLSVDGIPAVKTRYRASGSHRFDWEATVGGRVVMGWHTLSLRAVDSVGNESVATTPMPVQVRILSVRPKRIRVATGTSFTLTISTDRLSVRWRFNRVYGLAPSRSLTLTAPSLPGRYRVVVRSGRYRTGALVIVR